MSEGKKVVLGCLSAITTLVGVAIIVVSLFVGIMDALNYSPAVEIAEIQWGAQVELAEIAAASSPVSIMKDTIESLIILVILLAITILIGGLLAMFRRG